MEAEGGTFKVPILINNALTLKFTIDSGAADVSVPVDVVMTLIRTGTITRDDFIGTQTYQLADGSTVPSPVFRIKSLKIGDRELRDVRASVTNVNGSLLLGQSFLSRLSSWSIDNQRHVLVLGTGESITLPPVTQVAQTVTASNGPPFAIPEGDGTPEGANAEEQDAIERREAAYFAAWSGFNLAADAIKPFYAD